MRFILLAPMILLLAASASSDLPPPVRDGDYRVAEDASVRLGRLLFYDKVLSGNRNIACGTCHDHSLASADGLSLGVGEGGRGLGLARDIGAGAGRVEERVPRNAPALFNLGAREFRVLFWDGRVAEDAADPSGFATPAGKQTPRGLRHVLAAQALFPLTSNVEMAGGVEENALAREGAGRIVNVWRAVTERVRGIDGYLPLFRAAFPEIISAGDIGIAHIANALGEFMGAEWRADNSPFDRFLRGEDDLPPAALRGAGLFYGEAGCAACHTGAFQTDHEFHAIAMPQIGPGRMAGSLRDVGRMEVTGSADAYRFRTPSLRNVALTAPYGHAGAYATLENVVRHHLDPLAGLGGYDRGQAVLPADPALARKDFGVLDDDRELARIAAANELAANPMTDGQVADILAFLHALTDPMGAKGRLGKPAAVPSGLPVD